MRTISCRRWMVGLWLVFLGLTLGTMPVVAGVPRADRPAAPGLQCPPVIPTINDRCPAWSGTYDNPGGHGQFGTDVITRIAASPTGDRVYALGYSWDDQSASVDLLVAAYKVKDGETAWTARYDAGGSELATGLTVSADGSRVYATGVQDFSFAGSGDIMILALDAASGASLWSSVYTAPLGRAGISVGAVLSADGSRLYVGGYTSSGSIPDGALVLAYRTDTGDREWALRHDPNGQVENILWVARGPDDRLYLTGYTRPQGAFTSRDFVTLAVRDDGEAGGVVEWEAVYDGNGGSAIDIANGVAVSADGTRVAVTGTSERSSGGASDYATVLYDAATGERLWVARYGGEADANYTSGNAVEFSPSGHRVFVTGQAGNLVDRRSGYGTVAYDTATGQEVWSDVHNGPGDYFSLARSLAISPDGSRIYVTGEDGRGNIRDAVTVAYDTDGNRVWVGRYNDGSGPDWDIGITSAVAPDGKRLFVGVQAQHKVSTTGVNNSDFVTLAYDTA